MALTVAQLISDLRDHLGVGPSSPKWTDSICTDLINRSFWEIADKIEFQEKQAASVINTVAGQETLSSALVDEERIAEVHLQDGDEWIPLIKRTDYTIQDDRSAVTGTPEYYWIYTGIIYLNPVPDEIYPVRVVYDATLADLISSIPTPRVWHEIILYGALWRAWMKLNDYERVNAARAVQTNLIATTETKEAKERPSKHQSGFSVIRPSYRTR